ncbi:hypothetical protein BDR26DRAFT_866992 [Obelidium mucronatum]|nr:hypothetical protein BDR26DRAFT_866992 [Obelidium mucronatum]
MICEFNPTESDWCLSELIYPDEVAQGTPLILVDANTCTASAAVQVNTRSIALITNTLGCTRAVYQSQVDFAANNAVSFTIEPVFPLLRATFTYSPSDLYTITTAFVDDFESFSRSGSHFNISWCNWINGKIEALLQEDPSLPSSAILEFIINDSFQLFESFSACTPWGAFTFILTEELAASVGSGTTKVTLPHAYLLAQGFKTPLRLPPSIVQLDGQTAIGNGSSSPTAKNMRRKYHPPPLETREAQLASYFRQHSYELFQIECPFCLDTCFMKDAVRLFCGHIYCKECMDRYLDLSVREMSLKSEYPFLCPESGCKSPINLAYDETLKRLLSKEQVEKVLDGFKTHDPRSTSIVSCPRASCDSVVMKQVSGGSLVYCETCGTTWCDRCLVRVKGEHSLYHCDSQFVDDLRSRYIQLVEGSELKGKVDEKHPWIQTYIRWLEGNEIARKWVLQNASICPSCGLGIEKNDGCFHITCICGCHFCYECGNAYKPEVIYQHKCSRDSARLQHQQVDWANVAF